MAVQEREHPREVIRGSCAKHGTDEVIDWCVALLTSEVSPEEAFGPLLPKLKWITGPSAAWLGVARPGQLLLGPGLGRSGLPLRLA